MTRDSMLVAHQDVSNYVTGCTWKYRGGTLYALRRHCVMALSVDASTHELTALWTMQSEQPLDACAWDVVDEIVYAHVATSCADGTSVTNGGGVVDTTDVLVITRDGVDAAAYTCAKTVSATHKLVFACREFRLYASGGELIALKYARPRAVAYCKRRVIDVADDAVVTMHSGFTVVRSVDAVTLITGEGRDDTCDPNITVYAMARGMPIGLYVDVSAWRSITYLYGAGSESTYVCEDKSGRACICTMDPAAVRAGICEE